MPATTFDPARNLKVYFRCARDGSKTISFVDGSGVAKDVSAYQFDWQVKVRSQYPGNIIEILNADIVRPAVHQIQLVLTDATSNVQPLDYYHQLNVTLPNGDKKTWLTGIATAHNGEFDGVQDNASFTIYENGEQITIQITEGGSGGSVTLQDGNGITVDNTDPANPIINLGGDLLNNTEINIQDKQFVVGDQTNVQFEIRPDIISLDTGEINVTLLPVGSGNSLVITDGRTVKIGAQYDPAVDGSQFNGQSLIHRSLADTRYLQRSDGTLLGVANPAYAAGKLVWNSTTDILEFMNSNSMVRLQIGHELWTRVYNNTGVSIANGKAVYVSGTDAGTGLETVALARADAEATSRAIGLSTQAIANGSIGLVTSFGRVNDLDTSLLSANTVLYVSTTTAGELTETLPTYPNYPVRIGRVIVSNAATGVIQVTPPTYRTLSPSTIFFQPKAGSGRNIMAQLVIGNLGGTALAANSQPACPVIISEPTRITGLSFVVSAGIAATEFRAGIFNNIHSGGLNYPGTVIPTTDIQVFSSVSNGSIGASFASPITLQPGLYWLVYNSNGAAQMRSIAVANLPIVNGLSSGSVGANSNDQAVGWRVTEAYNAAGLTSPYPAGGTFQHGTSVNFMLIRLVV